MDYLIKAIAQHWDFSPSQYWHLRLLSAIALGPLLGVLYLIFSSWRAARKPSAPVTSFPTMWVSKDGQLLVRRARPQTPA